MRLSGGYWSTVLLILQLSSASAAADATLTLSHGLFVRMLTGDVGLRETLTSDDLSLDGSVVDLVRFFSLFDTPDGLFNIVTP